jgi:hypothetical protein
VKRTKSDATKADRPTVRPSFDVARFAKTTACPTPMPESASRSEPRPRVPSETTASKPTYSRRHSPSSLQAAVTRMLDRAPAHSSVDVLGMFDRVPRVRLGLDVIRALSLDHRGGFLLSLIDGTMTVATILDLCAMSHEEALQILSALLERNVIELI